MLATTFETNFKFNPCVKVDLQCSTLLAVMNLNRCDFVNISRKCKIRCFPQVLFFFCKSFPPQFYQITQIPVPPLVV